MAYRWKEVAHVLTVIDQLTLKPLCICQDREWVECLELGSELRGYPKSITIDNGTELCVLFCSLPGLP